MPSFVWRGMAEQFVTFWEVRTMTPQTFTFANSPFWPIAIGFFGLGTGYFIWAGQALLGFPKSGPEVGRTKRNADARIGSQARTPPSWIRNTAAFSVSALRWRACRSSSDIAGSRI